MANQRGESTSIGHFWNRCIDAVNNLFETYSFWTHAKDVEFDDGEVAQNKVGAINGITSDLSCEDESVALSAVAGKQLNDSLDGLKNLIITAFPYGLPLVPTLSANDNVISSHLSTAFQAFDDNGATEWSVQGSNAWIGYKFETAKVVKKVEYHPYIYGSEGYASTIYIQGSDDGSTWNTVHSFANPKTSTVTNVTFENETSYKYWRFSTVALAYNSSVYYTRLYSLQFYGF